MLINQNIPKSRRDLFSSFKIKDQLIGKVGPAKDRELSMDLNKDLNKAVNLKKNLNHENSLGSFIETENLKRNQRKVKQQG